ncbi:MAG: hypothetical protein DWH99_15610 [Planctomycetota bacterium]|nr:MAG: hypothetical protein DWH99_15610 [Planctomycetota bacterium]
MAIGNIQRFAKWTPRANDTKRVDKTRGQSPRFVTGSFAPKGQNEIAQGRAKRHPGSYAIALGTPTPQFAKALKGRNMLALIDAPPVPPFQG